MMCAFCAGVADPNSPHRFQLSKTAYYSQVLSGRDLRYGAAPGDFKLLAGTGSLVSGATYNFSVSYQDIYRNPFTTITARNLQFVGTDLSLLPRW